MSNSNYAATMQTAAQHEVAQDSARGLHFLELASPSTNVVDTAELTEFPVALDSGAADHVVDSVDTPGCAINESWGSKAGACFVAANGERIPNRGEVNLDIRAGKVPIKSIFEISQIGRPLWSVGKLCDAGYTLQFHKDHAEIKQVATGNVVATIATHNTTKQSDASSTFQRRTM